MKASNKTDRRANKISATMRRTDFPIGAPAAEDNLIHRSGRSGVVNKVWELCDRIVKEKGGTHKDLLARTRKLGIAEFTARTQYARWLNRGKKKAAKKAA